jgi:rod shape-determining protein MreB
MNEAIQRYIKDEYKVLIGENAAEKIKIELGSAVPFPEPRTRRVSGKNMVDGRPKTIEINDGQIRESIREPVNMIVTAVRNALEKTPPELVTDVSNNGMLLAGGGAMLRGLDQLISQQSEISVIVDEDPLTTVLRGTGIALEQEKSMEYVFVN